LNKKEQFGHSPFTPAAHKIGNSKIAFGRCSLPAADGRKRRPPYRPLFLRRMQGQYANCCGAHDEQVAYMPDANDVGFATALGSARRWTDGNKVDGK